MATNGHELRGGEVVVAAADLRCGDDAETAVDRKGGRIEKTGKNRKVQGRFGCGENETKSQRHRHAEIPPLIAF